MNRDLLIDQLDDLRELDGDFIGWVCHHHYYDPKEIGYEEVVEVLHDILDVISEARSDEILVNQSISEHELEELKAYKQDQVANSGGEHDSYWICRHPEDENIWVALFQYEDGSRELVDLFESFDDALAHPETAGFDCV